MEELAEAVLIFCIYCFFEGSDSKRGGAALRVQPENHYKPEKADLKRIK